MPRPIGAYACVPWIYHVPFPFTISGLDHLEDWCVLFMMLVLAFARAGCLPAALLSCIRAVCRVSGTQVAQQ